MKNGVRGLVLPLGDIVALFAAFFIMLAIAFPGEVSEEIVSSHFYPFIVVFLVWLFVFFLFNLYETQSIKPTIPHLQKIGLASLVALSFSFILFYTIPYFGITPKTNLVIFSLVFVILFLIWRRIFYKISASYFRKRVAFIVNEPKDGTYFKEVLNYITDYPQSGFINAGVYRSAEEFFSKRESGAIDTIIVSKNALTGEEDLKKLCNTSENILDLEYAYEDILGKIPVGFVDEKWFLERARSADTGIYEATLYLVNALVSILTLIVFSPLLLIVALFIKLDDGKNIFYTQLRAGKNGKPFKLYKFRSMIPEADKSGAEWTEKNDTRITKVGKIIRKLHVDEVPQFLNILKGDMALVGPRPEIPSFEEKLDKEIPYYHLRHIIAPGLTGWAQIKWRNARGIAESKEKFEYDLYYIKNRDIFMDFGIILRTIVTIFTYD